MTASNVDLRLERYEVLGQLGQGGMGVVYEAIEAITERRVALKVLRAELLRHEGAQARFRREIKTLCALEHPNIVRLHSAFEEGGRLVLVQELLVGETLEQLLARERQLGWRRAVDIGRQMAAALAHAHGQVSPIVHRDVKPSNVFLGENGVVKLLDFGIARALDEQRTETLGAGTLLYRSPEQIDARPLTPSTDLYNLGLLLFEMMMGGRPFEHPSNRELLQLQCTEPPPPVDVADAPDALAALVEALLAKDPEQRPASANQVIARLDALDSLSTAETLDAPPTRERAPDVEADEQVAAASGASSRWLVVAAVAVAAVVLVAWAVTSGGDEPERLEVETASASETSSPTETSRTGVEAPVAPETRGTDPGVTPSTETQSTAVEGPITVSGDQAIAIGVDANGQRIPIGVKPSTQASPGGSASPTQLRLADLLLIPEGMVEVPAGAFTTGSTPARLESARALCRRESSDGVCLDAMFARETPRQVTLERFFIDMDEVTVGEYQRCVDEGACTPLSTALCIAPDGGGTAGINDALDEPVSCVSVVQATAFCAQRGRRLPTADEWERAARGTDARTFPWGEAHPSAAGRVGNFADATAQRAQLARNVVIDYDDGFARKAPVRSFPAGKSPVGAFDMAGNVSEWTSTRVDGANQIRGGSFESIASWVRTTAVATADTPANLLVGATSLGFRCAKDP